jgi:cytochrome c peroxidase
VAPINSTSRSAKRRAPSLSWHWVVAALLGFAGAGCSHTSPQSAAARPPADELWQGAVVLGSPSLTAGIPGSGPLTIAEIKSWLANRDNHIPLQVALPLGLRNETPPPLPEDNPLTRAKIELGRQLFFDRRMSAGGTLGCVDCHHPQRNYTSDEIAHASLRETGVAFNRLLSQEQFWDGRAKSLEDQLRFPLENAHELKTTAEDCVARIAAIEGYRLQFDAVFGKLDFEALCQAVASFERVLVTGPSAWDYDVELQRLAKLDQGNPSAVDRQWLATVKSAAEQHPLSDSARRGADLFFSDRTGCSRCHSGPNFTDEQYHDIGLRARRDSKSPVAAKVAADMGRYEATKDEADRHAFKTPTLRNVALTWPYFHDGRYHKLSDVVQHFVRGGDAGVGTLQPLDLSSDDVQDLVAFLNALTGSLPNPPTDRLP